MSQQQAPLKPTLKWAGSKQQLADEIRDLMRDDYRTYHEPFAGSAAVCLAETPERATINDLNARLHNYYTWVRDDPKSVLAELEGFEDPEADAPEDALDDRNYYYHYREKFNRRPRGQEFDPIEEAALFQYLNRTGYNGLYRVNSDGEFNVPIGRYANPDWVQRERLLALSNYLSSNDVAVLSTDYSYVTDYVNHEDVVYLDPPYQPTSETADFTQYSAGGFDYDEQQRLLDVAEECTDEGAQVIISNSAVAKQEYQERGLDVYDVDVNRSISTDVDSRGETKEILALY